MRTAKKTIERYKKELPTYSGMNRPFFSPAIFNQVQTFIQACSAYESKASSLCHFKTTYTGKFKVSDQERAELTTKEINIDSDYQKIKNNLQEIIDLIKEEMDRKEIY